jgi:hypothetical protein
MFLEDFLCLKAKNTLLGTLILAFPVGQFVYKAAWVHQLYSKSRQSIAKLIKSDLAQPFGGLCFRNLKLR